MVYYATMVAKATKKYMKLPHSAGKASLATPGVKQLFGLSALTVFKYLDALERSQSHYHTAMPNNAREKCHKS